MKTFKLKATLIEVFVKEFEVKADSFEQAREQLFEELEQCPIDTMSNTLDSSTTEITEVDNGFGDIDSLPENIKDVIRTFNPDSNNSYQELERILTELKPLGYTFNYELDAEPFNLRKIK